MASKCKLTVLASSLSFFHSSPMIFEISGKVEAKKTHLKSKSVFFTYLDTPVEEQVFGCC